MASSSPRAWPTTGRGRRPGSRATPARANTCCSTAGHRRKATSCASRRLPPRSSASPRTAATASTAASRPRTWWRSSGRSAACRGVELVELPPSNQGIVALIILKMLARLGKPAAEPVSPERYHLLMETARLAFAMRDAFVADPDMADVPVEHMLNEEVIDTLVDRVDRRKHRAKLAPVPQPVGSDTVYFSIVDEKGMAVSFINSLFDEFGTGIVLHNRGKGFVTDPRHPNCIAPGKLPLHTLVPAMVLKGGRPYMAFGVMGAHFQPMGHVYVMSNMFDYGMDPQSALDTPRVFFDGDALVAEESVPEDVVAGLKR